MKWNDWYLAAAFVVAIWVVSMAAIVALGLAAGAPPVVVSHVTLLLSAWLLALALAFVLVGAGTVVAKDMIRKVRV